MDNSTYPGSPAEALLTDLLDQDLLPDYEGPVDDPLPAAISMEIDLNGTLLTLLTTVSTFGTPLDVTLQELHIEMSYPANEASDRFLRQHVVIAGP